LYLFVLILVTEVAGRLTTDWWSGNACLNQIVSDRGIDGYNPAHPILSIHKNNRVNRYRAHCGQMRKRGKAFANRYSFREDGAVLPVNWPMTQEKREEMALQALAAPALASPRSDGSIAA